VPPRPADDRVASGIAPGFGQGHGVMAA